jgi:hypothetical protein
MYFLIAALGVVSLLGVGTMLRNFAVCCLRPSLHPVVNKYCLSQYLTILGYHKSRIIHELNSEFLPESDKKIKLNQYVGFLKKIREKKVQPFVDVAAEIYTPPGTTSTVKTNITACMDKLCIAGSVSEIRKRPAPPPPNGNN